VDAGKANIPVAKILNGPPPPQGIPALGFTGSFNRLIPATQPPKFVSPGAASTWIKDFEPVILFEFAGEAKAYPLQIMVWHEIINDTVGGVPVAVTFCPLCNSAMAFDLRVPLTAQLRQEVLERNPYAHLVPLDDAFLEAYTDQHGQASVVGISTSLQLSFGNTGMLYNSNLLMFDSETSSFWSQISGKGNVGTLTGVRLLRYPAQIISFGEFRELFPEAPVLSRETGFARPYGQNAYLGYDRIDEPPFLLLGAADGRLPPHLRVASLELDGEAVAYPFDLLAEVKVINDTVAGVPITVFWQSGESTPEGEDLPEVAVFKRQVAGRTLSFHSADGEFVDTETGSHWNLVGHAVSGELTGTELEPVIHDNTFWFAWAAFKPGTRVYQQPQTQGE